MHLLWHSSLQTQLGQTKMTYQHNWALMVPWPFPTLHNFFCFFWRIWVILTQCGTGLSFWSTQAGWWFHCRNKIRKKDHLLEWLNFTSRLRTVLTLLTFSWLILYGSNECIICMLEIGVKHDKECKKIHNFFYISAFFKALNVAWVLWDTVTCSSMWPGSCGTLSHVAACGLGPVGRCHM